MPQPAGICLCRALSQAQLSLSKIGEDLVSFFMSNDIIENSKKFIRMNRHQFVYCSTNYVHDIRSPGMYGKLPGTFTFLVVLSPLRPCRTKPFLPTFLAHMTRVSPALL